MFGSKRRLSRQIYHEMYGAILFEGKLRENMSFMTDENLFLFDYFIVTLASGIECLGTFSTKAYPGEERAHGLSFSTVTSLIQPSSSQAMAQPVFITGNLVKSDLEVTLSYCSLTPLVNDAEDVSQEFRELNTTITRIDGYRKGSYEG